MFESLFRDFWWLIFPLSWFAYGAYMSWLSYRSNREVLDLIKTYAASGREPPAELFERFNGSRWHDDWGSRRWRRHGRRRGPYQVVLFGILCVGFGYAAVTDMYGDGQAFAIVAFVMGALSAASLTHALFDRNGPTV